MKRLTIKILTIVTIMLMVLPIMQIKAWASTENGILSIKKDENTYLIYTTEDLNDSFEFAFAKESSETNLNYINSITDNQGNNVAYVDAALQSTYFNGDKTYMWVKQNGSLIAEGVLVDLGLSKTEEQINSIQKLTKRIKVNSEAEKEKITIEEASEKYYYEMSPISSNEDYKTLSDLIDEIGRFDENTKTYKRLKACFELYDLYNSLVSQVNWNEAQSLEIDKPYDATGNQKYVLWLKDPNGKTDVQVLTSYKKDVTDKEEKSVLVNKTSKLPITYDDTVKLIIILTFILVAIIAMIVLKKKISKNEGK